MEKTFLEHITRVSKLFVGKNISYSTYEWTKDNSIFCKINIDGYNVYLEIFLDDKWNEIETIINVYKEGKTQLAYGGKIEDCLEEISKLIKI